MCNLNDWIQRYNDRTVGLIIGGDFNTDLDKSNPASDLLNRFIIDYKFETCDTVPYKQMDRNGLPSSMMSRVLSVRLIFSCVMIRTLCRIMILLTTGDGCILSDYVPILVECAITASICSCIPESVDMPSHSQTTVSQLRWDHANISLYRDLTGLICNLYYNILPSLRAVADAV